MKRSKSRASKHWLASLANSAGQGNPRSRARCKRARRNGGGQESTPTMEGRHGHAELGSLVRRSPRFHHPCRWPVVRRAAIVGFVAVAAVVIAAIMAKGQPRQMWESIGGIAFAFSCAATSFACTAIFLKFFDRRATALDSLRDNSYGIYLFHYALVNWLQYELLRYNLPALAKFGIVAGGAALSAWTITALLRSVPAVRRII